MVRLASRAILLTVCLAFIAPADGNARVDGVRVWTDVTGAHRVEARLADYRHGVVTLHKHDGVTIRLGLEQLSVADQAHVLQAKDLRVLFGRVVAVADGDTITVLDEKNQQHRVRLDAIDAPESRQDFGTQSRKHLSELVFGEPVRVEWKETDRYGRTLGRVFTGGMAVNLAMVRDGWAWHYKQFSDDETLARAELDARARRVGLWKDPSPIPPWQYRGRSSLAQPPDSEPVRPAVPPARHLPMTVYVTQTGTKYHAASCRHTAKNSIPMDLERAKLRYQPCLVCDPPR